MRSNLEKMCIQDPIWAANTIRDYMLLLEDLRELRLSGDTRDNVEMYSHMNKYNRKIAKQVARFNDD